MHEPQIRVLAAPAETPPVGLHRREPRESLPTRLDAAAVALRHPALRERFTLTARAIAAFRQTLDGLGFTVIQTPKLVAFATEGGANLFRADYPLPRAGDSHRRAAAAPSAATRSSRRAHSSTSRRSSSR